MAARKSKPKGGQSRRKGSQRRTAPQIERLKRAIQKVRGIDSRQLEKMLRPLGLAHGRHSKAFKEYERQFNETYKLINKLLSNMLNFGYPQDKVDDVTGILQGAYFAFNEQVVNGMEAVMQHIDEASQELEKLAELGPHESFR